MNVAVYVPLNVVHLRVDSVYSLLKRQLLGRHRERGHPPAILAAVPHRCIIVEVIQVRHAPLLVTNLIVVRLIKLIIHLPALILLRGLLRELLVPLL